MYRAIVKGRIFIDREQIPLVDGHLDLAENVTLFGRDLTRTAVERRAIEQRTTQQATVSLPDLERGGVAVVSATVWRQDRKPGLVLLMETLYVNIEPSDHANVSIRSALCVLQP